jgi:hypothetical protein
MAEAELKEKEEGLTSSFLHVNPKTARRAHRVMNLSTSHPSQIFFFFSLSRSHPAAAQKPRFLYTSNPGQTPKINVKHNGEYIQQQLERNNQIKNRDINQN